MRLRYFRWAMLVACALCAASVFGAQGVIVLQDGETNKRIPEAQVVAGGYQGGHALAMHLPAGKTGFFSLDLPTSLIDLKEYRAIAFWWKAQSPGLESFTVKFMHADIEGGRQALHNIWSGKPEDAPTEWTPALLVLSKPAHVWGDPQDKWRRMQFRTKAAEGSQAVILVDQVIGLPGAFAIDPGRPVRKDGRWTVPLRIASDGKADMRLELGTGEELVEIIDLPAGKTTEVVFPLDLKAGALAGLKPLDSIDVDVWAQIPGAPVTRSDKTVHVIKPIDLPAHPRLLVNAEQVRAIRDRIDRYAWAKEGWESLKKKADAALAQPVDIPPRGGTTPNIFSNPDTGGKLKRGKKIGPWQWEYTDKSTGEKLRGNPLDKKRDFDGVEIHKAHNRLARHAKELALAYQISGDKKYAEKSREILIAYADKYLTYQLGPDGKYPRPKRGRATHGYLLESMWVIPLLEATDMIWGVLSAEDRQTLSDKVFYPAVLESCVSMRCGIHNIQNWINSAGGLLGLLYDDPKLVFNAIHDPEVGYWNEMKEGVLPDGMWLEGAWGYHFFTILGATPLLEAARHCGIDLYGKEIEAMYAAPVRFCMPDLRLPNFNDTGRPVSIRGQARYYELAAARYDNPLFRAMVGFSTRKGQNALLYGIDQSGDPPPIRFWPGNFESTGYAILTRGEGDQATWLCLKYGPHGGWHGHPDKLTFLLYGRGAIVSPDPGSTNYGNILSGGWYKTSLAHDTLTVDEKSYTTKGEGKCRAFGETKDGVQYVVADSGNCWPGVTHVRTVALVGQDLIVVIDQVRGSDEHLYDIAYHQRGDWVDLERGEKWTPPDEAPYKFLRETEVRPSDRGFGAVTLVTDKLPVGFAFAPVASGEVITAKGIDSPDAKRIPMAIVRKKGRKLVLAWAVSLDGQVPDVALESVRDAVGETVGEATAVAAKVTPSAGVPIMVVANPEGREIAVPGGAVSKERVVVVMP